MKRPVFSFLLMASLTILIAAKCSGNPDAYQEPLSISLADYPTEDGNYMFYPHKTDDTVVLGDYVVSLWMDSSFILEMNDGEYQFNKLQIEIDGSVISIDSVLQYGPPYILNNPAVVVIPIMTMQNFDLTIAGKILFISLKSLKIDFELFQGNSMACCTVGDKFYFVSSDSLLCFCPATRQIKPILLFKNYSSQSVSVSLEPTNTNQLNLVYYENIEESILNQGSGKKVQLPLVY